jgi:hypothetical protein
MWKIIFGILSIAVPSVASADEVIAAGSLFNDGGQRIVCQFFNSGGSAITIINPHLYDQFGTPFPLTVNQCKDTPTLAPLKTCGIAVDNAESRSWSCRARVSPNKLNIRGILDIRNENGAVRSVVELR